MKRTTKLLCLLLVLLVVSLAAAIVPGMLPEAEVGGEEDTSVTLVSLEPEDVTAIRWENLGQDALSFTKTASGWVYDGDNAFPLNVKALDNVLDRVSQVVAYRTIDEPEEPALYGLNEPLTTVELTAGGETYHLELGDETSMGGQRYLSNGDGKVYLVNAELLDYFDCVLFDMIQYETVPDLSDASAITIQAETQTLSLVRMEDSGLAYSDEFVWFREQYGRYTALDTALVESLLNTFRELGWAECVTYSADEAALAEYGLDAPAATVTIDYVQTETIDSGKTDEDGNTIYTAAETPCTFVLEIGDYAGSYCYVRLGGSKMVYYVNATVSDTALYTTADTLLPNDVLLMDWDSVTGMDILLNGETYSFTFETGSSTDEDGNVTEERRYLLDGQEVSLEKVLSALDDIGSVGYAYGVTPERSQEIAFRIYRNRDTYSQVELVFYQYDSTTCLTRLMGESTLFADREDIVNLIEKVNAIVLN